jgi:hypothetical protein
MYVVTVIEYLILYNANLLMQVHCCGAGKMYSKDMKDKEEGDPYFMVQIISSAIVNVPPPQALLTILNQNSSFITFNGNTEERMYNLFKRSPNGNTVSFVYQNLDNRGKKNFFLLVETPDF